VGAGVVVVAEDSGGRGGGAATTPRRGSGGGRRARGAPPRPRRFLTRLHITRGYPPSPGVRWFWALSVGLVSLAMVFWVASGLVMWWQLKAVRRTGLAVVVMSAAAAVWLAMGMHAQFAS